jgi:uncharacterized protein
MPLELIPFVRWHMAWAERGETGYKALRRFARAVTTEADAMLADRRRGPFEAPDSKDGTGRSG